jgi:hypothetical protein
MSKNDLLANEKRWRRKSLFRKKRPHPIIYLIGYLTVSLLILITLTLLALWLDIPFVSNTVKELLS